LTTIYERLITLWHIKVLLFMTHFQYQFIGFDAAEITNNVNFHTAKIERILSRVVDNFKDLPVISIIFKKTAHGAAPFECDIQAGDIHIHREGNVISELATSVAHKVVQIVRRKKE
jgi:hypothetical protein